MKKPTQHKITRFLAQTAQSTIEFTFCLVIVVLLAYGVMKAFRWVGLDLAERRATHDGTLTVPIDEKWTNEEEGPLKQLSPGFYRAKKMGLVFNEW